MGSRVYSDAMWGFDGDGPYDWSELEDGISFVLDRLGSARNLIAGYKKDHNVIWWCGHFQSAYDGGPKLSEDVLRRLADFGVPLFIDTYFEADDRGIDRSSEGQGQN